MALLKLVHRVLLYGIFAGALALPAITSSAWSIVPPATLGRAGALLDGGDRGSSEALLQYVHLGRFCRWYQFNRLCVNSVTLRRFCDRRPDHRLCDDDDDDRFCRRHPHHRHCDDKPPSPS
jgi:hypothetical protein